MNATARIEDQETQRLSALTALDLLNDRPEAAFDALARIAARAVGVPIAAVTVIDATHMSALAATGIPRVRLPRNESFCDHTIRDSQPLIVRDALDDPRFADLAIVLGDPHCRFYAGIPIAAHAAGVQVPVGALCVLDQRPRDLTAEQVDALNDIARVAEQLLAIRSAARQALDHAERSQQQARVLARKDRIFRQAERLAMIGSWRLELATEQLEWSDGVRHIHRVDDHYQPKLSTAMDFYPPHAAAIVTESIRKTIETGEPFDFETDMMTRCGEQIRVRGLGEAEWSDGKVVSLTGVFQDVTTRYLMEQDLRRSAQIDSLTGIGNRAAFDLRLDDAFARARDGGSALTVALIDLDEFKSVNDTYGHIIGDDVLRAHGLRLRSEWLSDSFPARLGGDEFALILEGAATLDADQRVARLLDLLAQPIVLPGRTLRVPGTIGWAAYTPDMLSVRDLIRAADSVLYDAKRDRRGTARVAAIAR